MWTIASWYEEARQGAERGCGQIRKMIDFRFSIYEKGIPGKSRAEIARILAKSNRERLDAVPDLGRYPELRGMRELVEAEWRGIRDGAGLTDDQWAVHCDGGFYGHRYIASGRKPPTGCSYVYFPRSDRGPILANNLDSAPQEPFGPPGWPAVNEHLIIGGVSSGIFNDEESPELFPVPVFKLLGRYCRSTAEAVELLNRYTYFWGPGNLLVIDRRQDVAMVEKSACRIGVRRSPDGFGLITAMTAEEPAMNAYLADRRAHSLKARGLPPDCDDAAYWKGGDRRRALMNELLDEGRKNPTLEKLRQVIQFRDPKRGLVCYNGEPLPSGAPVEHTIRTTIWLLREGRAMWWAIDGATPSFKNRREDVEFKDVLRWE
jgi:hypothetical protein